MNTRLVNTEVVVRPTVDEKSYDFHKEMSDSPLEIFLDLPTESIRRACLKVMNADAGFHHYPVDYVEKVVNGLMAVHDDFWLDLLECFVAKANNETAPAAIEFAIQLAMKEFLNNDVVKTIVAKLLGGESYGAYWNAPSMEPLICRLLEQPGRSSRILADEMVRSRRNDNNYGYLGPDWVQVERAVKIIMKFGDTTFLPILKKLLGEMESGNLKRLHSGKFEAADDLNFLRTRTEGLAEIAEEEKPDWNLLGSIAKREAQLIGDVNVFFSCPTTVEESQKAVATISLQTTNADEQLKLDRYCGSFFKVAYGLEGFDANVIGGVFVDKTWFPSTGSSWDVELTPTIGKNRLTVYLYRGFWTEELARVLKATTYIRCVKAAPVESENIIV